MNSSETSWKDTKAELPRIDSDNVSIKGSKHLSIGIYGGTFDPPHNGHVALAKAFLSQVKLDEVWLVVSPQNPFKTDKQLLDDHLRLAMVREAIKGERGLKVSDVEFSLPKPSYMYRTLRHLSEEYPNNKFTLLIGGDNWEAFDKWKNADEIVQNYDIVIYPRRNEKFTADSLPPHVTLLDTPLLDISSTEIRQRIHDGLPINDLVPSNTARFIEEHELYRHP